MTMNANGATHVRRPEHTIRRPTPAGAGCAARHRRPFRRAVAFLLRHMHPARSLADLLDFPGRRCGGSVLSTERFRIVIAFPPGTKAILSQFCHQTHLPDLSAVPGRDRTLHPDHHVRGRVENSGAQPVFQPVLRHPVQWPRSAGTLVPDWQHPFERIQQRHLVPDSGDEGVVVVPIALPGGQPKQGHHQSGGLRSSVRHFGIEHAIPLRNTATGIKPAGFSPSISPRFSSSGSCWLNTGRGW